MAQPAATSPGETAEREFTEVDGIKVELRYIRRVRSMLPSPRAVRDLDEQEAGLNARLERLAAGSTRTGATGTPGPTRATA